MMIYPKKYQGGRTISSSATAGYSPSSIIGDLDAMYKRGGTERGMLGQLLAYTGKDYAEDVGKRLEEQYEQQSKKAGLWGKGTALLSGLASMFDPTGVSSALISGAGTKQQKGIMEKTLEGLDKYKKTLAGKGVKAFETQMKDVISGYKPGQTAFESLIKTYAMKGAKHMVEKDPTTLIDEVPESEAYTKGDLEQIAKYKDKNWKMIDDKGVPVDKNINTEALKAYEAAEKTFDPTLKPEKVGKTFEDMTVGERFKSLLPQFEKGEHAMNMAELMKTLGRAQPLYDVFAAEDEDVDASMWGF